MTTYQENPYYFVDSPLNQPDDDEAWWIAPNHAQPAADPMAAVQQRMMMILAAAFLFMVAFGFWAIRSTNIGPAAASGEMAAQPEAAAAEESVVEQVVAPPAPTGGIAPLFTPEIQHWAPQIVAWAAAVGIDPNMSATVMQIESCGEPNAVSSAGPHGLVQVMT